MEQKTFISGFFRLICGWFLTLLSTLYIVQDSWKISIISSLKSPVLQVLLCYCSFQKKVFRNEFQECARFGGASLFEGNLKYVLKCRVLLMFKLLWSMCLVSKAQSGRGRLFSKYLFPTKLSVCSTTQLNSSDEDPFNKTKSNINLF